MRIVLVKVVYGFLLSQLQVVPTNGKRAQTNGRTLAMSASSRWALGGWLKFVGSSWLARVGWPKLVGTSLSDEATLVDHLGPSE